MQLSDLAEVRVVCARTVGMKTDDDVVKLLFRNGRKEEEVVLFPNLFGHAMGVPDEEITDFLKNSSGLVDKAKVTPQLGKLLERFWKA